MRQGVYRAHAQEPGHVGTWYFTFDLSKAAKKRTQSVGRAGITAAKEREDGPVIYVSANRNGNGLPNRLMFQGITTSNGFATFYRTWIKFVPVPDFFCAQI